MYRSRRPVQEVTLRPRRQLTLPAEICEILGIEVGDRLEVSVVDDELLVRPKRAAALRALRGIRRAFAESGISEEELQAEGRRIRERLSRERHGRG